MHALSKDEAFLKKYSLSTLKSVLFMIFHIDSNSRWAIKLNHAIMKCHDKLEGNRSNYLEDFDDRGSFDGIFLRVAEIIEKSYNFDGEIRMKSE